MKKGGPNRQLWKTCGVRAAGGIGDPHFRFLATTTEEITA